MKTTSILTENDRMHYILIPRSIILWILRNIHEPIQGFEHKRNEHGEYISYEEQITETQYQLMLIASEYCQRRASRQHILEVLSKFRHDCGESG